MNSIYWVKSTLICGALTAVATIYFIILLFALHGHHKNHEVYLHIRNQTFTPLILYALSMLSFLHKECIYIDVKTQHGTDPCKCTIINSIVVLIIWIYHQATYMADTKLRFPMNSLVLIAYVSVHLSEPGIDTVVLCLCMTFTISIHKNICIKENIIDVCRLSCLQWQRRH